MAIPCNPVISRYGRKTAAPYLFEVTTMIRQDIPADPTVHELAMRLARQCRHIVQACLREEEWPEADREFSLIICRGLETFRLGDDACTSGTS